MNIFSKLNKATSKKLQATKEGSNKETRVVKKHTQAKKQITSKFMKGQ